MSPPSPPAEQQAARSRTVDQRIPVAAPTDVVWRALTEARELMRWFPLEAGVSPGRGGTMRMCWPGEFEEEARIDVWEPGRHLRVLGFPSGGAMTLVTDYYLESSGGGTVVRVVSSGFGAGEEWDELYEGVRCGWEFELRSLRQYLERHRGEDRRVAWARTCFSCGHAAAWERITRPGGWFGAAGLTLASPGERYRFRTATGEELAGRVEVSEAPRQFAGTVENWNHGLFRLELWGREAAGRAVAWLATWGEPSRDIAALEQAWQGAMDACLGGGRADGRTGGQ